MKKKSILLVLSIMALAVFGIQEAAHAGGQGSGAVQFIYPNATATGTEVHGIVTLFFTGGLDPFTGSALNPPPCKNATPPPDCNQLTLWFLRVKTPEKLVNAGAPPLLSYDQDGSFLYAGLEDPPACNCGTAGCCAATGINPNSVQAKLINAIENTSFFSDLNITCKNPNKSPAIQLKSYSNFIQSDDSGWLTMNVVMAVACEATGTGD